MNCIARKLLPLLLLLAGSTKAHTISGRMYDSTEDKAVPFAVIAILKPVDSVLVKFSRTGKDAKFELKHVPPGQYVLMSTHPHYADFVDDVSSFSPRPPVKYNEINPKKRIAAGSICEKWRCY